MRILHVISHYKPAIELGGPLQVVSGLSPELINRDCEVVVICTNIKDDRNYLDVEIDKPYNINGVIVYYQKINFLRYWGYSFNFKKRVLQEAAGADLIITHFHYQYASFIGGYVARKLNVPFVIFTHGSLNKNRFNGLKCLYKSLYLKLIENQNFLKTKILGFLQLYRTFINYKICDHRSDITSVVLDMNML